MPELPWLQTPWWQMTYSHLLLSRQKCMDSTTAPELDLSNCNYNMLGFVFFLIPQPSISESQIHTRLRQNRGKLHQLFLPSSCFSERIPVTPIIPVIPFFRPILEVKSSRRTWAYPNSKVSILPLHSTIFYTSAQFRSELISTKAVWSHPRIAFLLQPLCLRRISSPAYSSQAPPGWALSWGLIYSCLTSIEDLVLTKVCSADCRSAWHSELSTEEWFTASKDTIRPFTLQNSRYYAQLQQAREFSNHVFYTWQQNF